MGNTNKKAQQSEGRKLDPEELERIVQRIVQLVRPEKIILFGSPAWGAMGPNSDVDLLVIKSGANRLDLTGEIYRHLHGIGEAVDVVVVTPEDVERYGDNPSLVISPALEEGRVVYAA